MTVTAVVGGVVGDRGRRRGRGESARGRARGVVGVRALRPNAEWPPEDVWEDFVAAHAGEYGARRRRSMERRDARCLFRSGTSRMRSKSTAWT